VLEYRAAGKIKPQIKRQIKILLFENSMFYLSLITVNAKIEKEFSIIRL
jgi:hypothetical protein